MRHSQGYGGLHSRKSYTCSQCSTIVKRRWHVLRMLNGAIPSTWALALALALRARRDAGGHRRWKKLVVQRLMAELSL